MKYEQHIQIDCSHMPHFPLVMYVTYSHLIASLSSILVVTVSTISCGHVNSVPIVLFQRHSLLWLQYYIWLYVDVVLSSLFEVGFRHHWCHLPRHVVTCHVVSYCVVCMRPLLQMTSEAGCMHEYCGTDIIQLCSLFPFTSSYSSSTSTRERIETRRCDSTVRVDYSQTFSQYIISIRMLLSILIIGSAVCVCFYIPSWCWCSLCPLLPLSSKMP